MYKSRINLGVMMYGIVILGAAITWSILLAFPIVRDNSIKSLTPIASLAFLGAILMVLAVIFPRKKGGIPMLMPKDYIDESFVFCPIKEVGDFWLATITVFWGETVAISQLDFAPKDKEFIQASLEKSIQEEKRLKITAYSCWVGKGYIFVLVDPKDQKKNSQNGA